jgi:hypothetical protein
MTLAFMSYSLAIATLMALAALLLERALGGIGLPRRIAWIAGIAAALVTPALVLVFKDEAAPAVVIVAPGNENLAFAMQPVVSRLAGSHLAGWTLDQMAAAAWVSLSAMLIFFYALSAWGLARRMRGSHETAVDSQLVAVTSDMGPAVFGWRRPRIIFPAWLMSAPSDIRRLALAHEHQHLMARDPQVLLAATVLSTLLPWNPALLWMLRRLRFAMEVDCDARVLRAGADAGEYGLTLLYVSERQTRAPVAATALIERASQLERRIDIMFSTPRKLPVLAAGICLTLAAGCLLAASQVDVPSFASSAGTVLKPPPGQDTTGWKLGQHFELHIREKYPELMGGNFEGTPVIVVQLNDDWSIARSAMTMNPNPVGEINATSEVFGILGIPSEDAPYVGAMSMQMARGKFALVIYTEHKRPDMPLLARFFPDTRAQDRAIFQRHFQAGIPAGENPWVLLDRSGEVVRKGVEVLTPQWNKTLEQRFSGIQAQEMTVTPITNDAGEPVRDDAGKELQLYSVWLAPGSPQPAE